jgi:hypothetical protein
MAAAKATSVEKASSLLGAFRLPHGGLIVAVFLLLFWLCLLSLKMVVG